MANLSRKRFIERASVSAVAVGAVATIPGFSLTRGTADAAKLKSPMVAHNGPVLAHVRNAATGEIAVFVGEREVVIHDRVVAERLLMAAK